MTLYYEILQTVGHRLDSLRNEAHKKAAKLLDSGKINITKYQDDFGKELLVTILVGVALKELAKTWVHSSAIVKEIENLSYF